MNSEWIKSLTNEVAFYSPSITFDTEEEWVIRLQWVSLYSAEFDLNCDGTVVSMPRNVLYVLCGDHVDDRNVYGEMETWLSI